MLNLNIRLLKQYYSSKSMLICLFAIFSETANPNELKF